MSGNIGYGSGKSNISWGSKAAARSAMDGEASAARACEATAVRLTAIATACYVGRRSEAVVTRAAPDPDVIPVPPGEEIDATPVGAYLTGRLPYASGPPEVWPFPCGHPNRPY